MEFDIGQITTIGFSGVSLLGLSWFLKRLLEKEGWGETFVAGWKRATESFHRATESIESMNMFMKTSLESHTQSLDLNANNMQRQERAGKAFCDYLRRDIETRAELDDDSKADLQKKINEIEEGLTK